MKRQRYQQQRQDQKKDSLKTFRTMKPFVFAAFDEGLDQEEAIDYGASEAGYDPENLPTGVKAMFRQALSGKQGGMKICPGNNNQKNDDLQNQ